MRVPWAFVRKDFLEQLSYGPQMFLGVFGVLIGLLFFNFLSQQVGTNVFGPKERFHGDFFEFLVFGMAMYSFFDAALRELSRIIRSAQILGTFEALLTTRTSLPMLVFCLPLHAYAWIVLRVTLYLSLGALIFDMRVKWGNWPAALVVFLLTLLAFGALGLGMAGLTIVFKRTERWIGLLSTLTLLFGGVFYPVEQLPESLRAMTPLLPISHGLEGVRLALIEGAEWGQVLPSLRALGIFNAIVVPFAIMLFAWAVRRAMRDGTLTQY